MTMEEEIINTVGYMLENNLSEKGLFSLTEIHDYFGKSRIERQELHNWLMRLKLNELNFNSFENEYDIYYSFLEMPYSYQRKNDNLIKIENANLHRLVLTDKCQKYFYESKTKRSNVLFRPSIYEDLASLARLEGTSVNDILHNLAIDLVIKKQASLNKWDEIQKEIKRLNS